MEVINTEDKYPSPKEYVASNTEPINKSKSFVFFGERLTLDTYALDHLVYPDVKNRFMPNGLDFAITMLDSGRAFQILDPDYVEQISNIKEDIKNWDPKDRNNLNLNTLGSLSELTKIRPTNNETELSRNMPEFMKSSPWLDEKLTTVLGSWAQLKHDTILYAKQGYTSITCSTPEGYVEPYPDFYHRLNDLNSQFYGSLVQFEEFGFEIKSTTFDLFRSALEFLENISISELSGVQLDDSQRNFINTTYSLITGICGITPIDGWLGSIIGSIDPKFGSFHTFPDTQASLIADIHTDLNSGEVLEVATGYLEHIIAKVQGFNGTEILVVGPVFSYYEFINDMDNRLNDEEWRGLLQEESLNASSVFKDTSIRGFWSSSYMVSLNITYDNIYSLGDRFDPPKWYSIDTNPLLLPYSQKIQSRFDLIKYSKITKFEEPSFQKTTDETSFQNTTGDQIKLSQNVEAIYVVLIIPIVLKRRFNRRNQ